ncbi:hypothetical protein [Sphaerochaeta sp. PS]|uniref:hypothetical protein n=1 Tax=Sphaerochaeta sp. PS TaxID=3076336 RepID=UPI0028A35D8E|nr:hypothetical protein [Sphaerochaeta sp. PS]MDT4762028.1 hypothetical protein [Sphaerochaeta sp. PS]
MPIYLANTGLEVLIKGPSLDEEQLLTWLREAKRIPAQQGAYYSKLFDSGLELVFRSVKQDSDLEIAGLDMHMSGRCLWQAKPLAKVGIGEPLLVSLLMTNADESSAFIIDLIHAATLERIDEDSSLSLQVCAFPQSMDIYDSRASYESAVEGPARLDDRKLLPFNYIMARDESLEQASRDRYAEHEKVMVLAAPVLKVEKREHGFKGTSCTVATVATEMGHLDLVFSESQLSRVLEKGHYVVCSCIISGDVLSE